MGFFRSFVSVKFFLFEELATVNYPLVTVHAISIFIRNPNSKKTSGGAEENRTLDPLLAKQVLSQLSYSPIYPCRLSPRHELAFATLLLANP